MKAQAARAEQVALRDSAVLLALSMRRMLNAARRDPRMYMPPREAAQFAEAMITLSRASRGEAGAVVGVDVRGAQEKVRVLLEGIAARVRGEDVLVAYVPEPEEAGEPEAPESEEALEVPEPEPEPEQALRRLSVPPQASPEPGPRPQPVEVVDALPYGDPLASDARR